MNNLNGGMRKMLAREQMKSVNGGQKYNHTCCICKSGPNLRIPKGGDCQAACIKAGSPQGSQFNYPCA